jgi:hypothetical protein
MEENRENRGLIGLIDDLHLDLYASYTADINVRVIHIIIILHLDSPALPFVQPNGT